MRKVEVVPYDSRWRQDFEAESQRISEVLVGNIVAVHHIGSTSIPGIYAKPVIDVMAEVEEITRVDEQSPALVSLGYEAMGEYGIPGRRYFRKETPEGIRTHHLHIFEADSVQVKRHLLFRDYMIAHSDDANRYSDLKRQLAAAYPTDIDGYMDGKDGFIKAMDQRAAQWHMSGRRV